MPTSAYVIGVLVVLGTALFAVAYHFVPLYWAYRATDASKRAVAVRGKSELLRADLRAAEATPPPVPADGIRADAFDECLRSVPIDALTTYPGIGDATVQRLAAAGFRTLRDAGRLLGSYSVPGIGESRMRDVVAAVKEELRRQRERFDAGTGPHAQRATAEIARLTAERDAAVERNEAHAAWLRQALADIRPAVAAAGKVTFWSFLRHHRATPGRPWPYDPVLDAPLPQVEPPAAAALPVARAVLSAAPPVKAVAPPRAERLPDSVTAAATVLLAVARADGRLAAAERAAVRRGLAKLFEHDAVLVRAIDPAVERLASGALDLDAALRLAATFAPADRRSLRESAAEVAAATRTRHPAREEMLARVERALPSPAADAVASVPAPPNGELRSNVLLDDLFAPPAAAPVTPKAPAAGGLRENALLDDVFGG